MAFGPDGPAAFCQFVPAPGINGYSLDVMRRSLGDHPNGLTDFVLVETIRHLKESGFRRLGLNFATMRAVLAGEAGDGTGRRMQRWLLERMSESLVMQLGGNVLDAGLAKSDPRRHAVIVTAYGLAAEVGRELPHSRKQESEADHLGLIYMARAGYDPEAAVTFWERFSEYNRQHGGSEGVWFLRTHPVDDVRIKQLKEWLPEAKREYRPRN